MKFAILFLLALFLPAVGYSTTYYVPDDFDTIQEAIDASWDTVVIVVRPGTYVENIDFKGTDLTVVSEKGPVVTIIDGAQTGPVVTFATWEEEGAILDGFFLTNGYGQSTCGGGIHCLNASPTIRNNIIEGNKSYLGGGIYCEGIYCMPAITGNIIKDNSAEGSGNINGGGIYCCGAAVPTITNTIITGNRADLDDGAIYAYYSDPIVTNSTIAKNTARNGGGIYCKGADPQIINSIFWDNYASGYGPQACLFENSHLTISYSDVEGGENLIYVSGGSSVSWGLGMISTYPFFVDQSNGDLHLRYDSPCRDTGDNLATGLPPEDCEGDPRIALGTVDMGVDEYYYHLYHIGDVIPGSPIDLKVVGYPNAPVTLYLGSGIVHPPYSTQHGDFWLNWPPLWKGEIGKVPGNGIKVLSTTVPTGWTSGSEHPLQALVGPWGGPLTLLTNAEVLAVVE